MTPEEMQDMIDNCTRMIADCKRWIALLEREIGSEYATDCLPRLPLRTRTVRMRYRYSGTDGLPESMSGVVDAPFHFPRDTGGLLR